MLSGAKHPAAKRTCAPAMIALVRPLRGEILQLRLQDDEWMASVIMLQSNVADIVYKDVET